MDPWRAKQGRPDLSKGKRDTLQPPPRIHRMSRGFVSSSSASLPARSAHTSGKALQHQFLHLESQVQKTNWLVLYNFMTLLFILKEKPLVSFHWGWTWLSQQFDVRRRSNQNKIFHQDHISRWNLLPVTNSVIMLSDACFHFVIGSAGIISLLSVFNQTDCNQPHVFIVFFTQLAFWLSWVPAVNGWELCLFSCLHSHTTDFITALRIWIWVLIDSIPHI